VCSEGTVQRLKVVSTALHCTALHCTALHCTALHCTALHCTALHCTALHCTALHCNGTTTTTWRGEHSLRSRWCYRERQGFAQ
jgi:hypothetical protein